MQEEELEDVKSSNNAKMKSEIANEDKAHSFKMRIMVYECLMFNVPTGDISKLILSFAKRFGVKLEAKDIPVQSTVEYGC